MSNVKDFLEEWWYVIFMALFIMFFIVMIIIEVNQPRFSEGYVTNKMHFPAYSICAEKSCDYVSEKWIVTVQNGDEFDSWYVSERYYDDVHIGDWVRK